ncbi:MAG: hypothetical protein KatS3mg053_0697 [Candidatus Roseilinea sp.]|nr:MAG: hypothetical protein KatS3mg053_0697 [Candidatus Roseilinea sp.]
MVFLRLFGLLLGLLGMILLLIGIVFGDAAVQNVPLTYALFAILVGLLLAVGANAGERMSEKQKEQKAKKEKKS